MDSPAPIRAAAADDAPPLTRARLPPPLRALLQWAEARPPVEEVASVAAAEVDPAELPGLFLREGRPVVVRGFLAGTPLQGISFERLRGGPAGGHLLDPAQKPGLVVHSYAGWVESLRAMTLAEYLDREVLAPRPPAEDLYKRYRNIRVPGAFREALGLVRPSFLAEDEVNPPCVWIGREGRHTPLHTDPLDNFVLMPIGVKRFHLYSPAHLEDLYFSQVAGTTFLRSPVDPRAPDPARHPRADGVPTLAVDVGPGDLFFLPMGWPHLVECRESSFSYNYWLHPTRKPFFARPGAGARG